MAKGNHHVQQDEKTQGETMHHEPMSTILQEGEALRDQLQRQTGARIVAQLVEDLRDLLFHRDALLWAIQRHQTARGAEASAVDQELYQFVPTSLRAIGEELEETIRHREWYRDSLDTDIKMMLEYKDMLRKTAPTASTKEA